MEIKKLPKQLFFSGFIFHFLVYKIEIFLFSVALNLKKIQILKNLISNMDFQFFY